MNGFENEFTSRKAEDQRLRQELENKKLELQAQESARQERARQAERIRLRSSTSVQEALGDGATIALEFLEFMKKNQFPNARRLQIITGTRQEHSSLFDAILNRPRKTVDDTSYLRGYQIGRRVVSSDSHWGMSGDTEILLCEDGMVREDGISDSNDIQLGDIDGPGFEFGLYHNEYTTEITRGDYVRQVSYVAFSQMSLEETLQTLAHRAISPPQTQRRSYIERRRP